jgi:hypothetical protein
MVLVCFEASDNGARQIWKPVGPIGAFRVDGPAFRRLDGETKAMTFTMSL